MRPDEKDIIDNYTLQGLHEERVRILREIVPDYFPDFMPYIFEINGTKFHITSNRGFKLIKSAGWRFYLMEYVRGWDTIKNEFIRDYSFMIEYHNDDLEINKVYGEIFWTGENIGEVFYTDERNYLVRGAWEGFWLKIVENTREQLKKRKIEKEIELTLDLARKLHKLQE